MTSRRPILIVDDDDDVRDTFGDALRFEGFAVTGARHGQEAIEVLRGNPAKRWLVLLDLMMPVMDGEAFLRVRREDPILAAFPVIILTAGGDCRHLQATHDIAGCRPKTIPLRELIAMIDACG